jgi:hypothetical protein
MAPQNLFDTDQIKDRARKDILYLLEGVSKLSNSFQQSPLLTLLLQIRGKKNLVIEQALAGPLGVIVRFSTLQDYGVDKLFVLENGNADTSQKNIVFLARGESAKHAHSIAGTFIVCKKNLRRWNYFNWLLTSSSTL